jgi:hypothetical protein
MTGRRCPARMPGCAGVKRHPELVRHIASLSDVTEPLLWRVVHGVHRGDPRIAQRPPRVRRSDARGVAVGPRGRHAGVGVRGRGVDVFSLTLMAHAPLP